MNKRPPVSEKMQMETGPTRGSPGPKLDANIKARIGQQLRSLYGGVVQEGVPERFMEILRRFDEGTSGTSAVDRNDRAIKDERSTNELS